MKELQLPTAFSHYRIVSKLGAGGMGEVYLAEDKKLERKVALKILPRDVAANKDRMDRFVREAKSAAALSHPNIAHVYEIGESEGTHFIAMEFIDGVTLREKIHRDKAPLWKLLKYLNQVAAGLAKAHSAGIVHRDLKPENIMITRDDYAKVLDFGLAKLVEPRGTVGLSDSGSSDIVTAVMQGHSTPGMVIGTLGYMSPEQASGRVNVIDHRSDIFSFGCILFEAATGRKAFEGKDALDSLHKTVHAPTPQLKDINPLAPDDLQRVVRRCLAKEPEKRYQSIREVAIELDDLQEELKRLTRPDPGPQALTKNKSPAPETSAIRAVSSFEGRPAIAVLPLDNRSDDPEQEYFADGLAEDLIARLSLWRAFPVISRNSSFGYKHKSVDVKKVSAELGVRYVVQGSVQKAGNRVRITAQLVDASSGQQIWANRYDRDLTDVFAVQDEISEAIAASLVGDLERAEHVRAQRRAPESLEAWGLYQRALPLIYNFTREDCARARALLERAIAMDENFSTAWARLAEVGVWEIMYEWTNDSERTLTIAVAEARRAVVLDSLDPQAHAGLSFALMAAGDSQGALEEARKAADLNPSMPFALAIHAHQRHIAGYAPEESISLVERALRLSPHDPVEWLFYDVLAGAYLNAGRFTEGLEAGQRLVALSPNYYWGYLWSAMNEVGLGRIEAAHDLVQKALRVKPELSFELARKCLGTMAPDVERRFLQALRQAGLEEEPKSPTRASINNDSPGYMTKTIAVLPFRNLSGAPEQEYFADGITEEIINALGQIPGLRVAGRSSSFSFKGRNEDLRSVGAKLSVATILEGTLRRFENRLRITAQLIDAVTGYQLWSERYDGVMEDVFAVQDKIASKIAGRLQLSLGADHEPQNIQPPTRHIGAYELYLKGRSLLYQRGLSIVRAIDCFKQAVLLDPSYAQAWAGLADGYTTSGYSGFKPAKEVMPLALDAARRALQLDSELAEAHSALACPTLLFERDYNLAQAEFLRALELNPNYPQARAWYGLFFLQWVSGRQEEAHDELLRLLLIEPLSGYANVIFSFFCVSSDRLKQAVEYGRRGVELDPDSYLAQWSLAVALECDGQYAEAAATAERALAISGRHIWALTTLTSIYAAWNKPDDARAVYRELQARKARDHVQPAMIAIAAAAVGEMDQAIAFAQEALDESDPLFVMLARAWPQNTKLRTDSRFLEIVNKLALPNWKGLC